MNKFFITVALVLFLPSSLWAAEFGLRNSAPEARLGDALSVEVLLNSPDEPINALEGSINFSPTLKLKEIRFAGSVVPLWVVKPAEEEVGHVVFAGLLPGGYQGLIDVFVLVFEPAQTGETMVGFGPDAKVYKNDGDGGLAELTKTNLSLKILASSGVSPVAPPEEDILPPEMFTPIITSGAPFGYDGRVLVFQTQDKGSGVAHYDVGYSNLPNRNSQSLSWQTTESPFFLPVKDPKFFLYVRATDVSGNERLATVRLMSNTLLFTYFLGLLGIIIGLALFLRIFLARRQTVKNE